MPSEAQVTAAIERIREEGRLEGVQQGRRDILDWLEVQYLGPKAPERKSVEGEAILELTREASKHLKKLNSKKGKKR